ncbi:hypothetical protein AAHE18_10G090800 [Arachis hypogaea]
MRLHYSFQMQGRMTETLDGETMEMTGLETKIRWCISGCEEDETLEGRHDFNDVDEGSDEQHGFNDSKPKTRDEGPNGWSMMGIRLSETKGVGRRARSSVRDNSSSSATSSGSDAVCMQRSE